MREEKGANWLPLSVLAVHLDDALHLGLVDPEVSCLRRCAVRASSDPSYLTRTIFLLNDLPPAFNL